MNALTPTGNGPLVPSDIGGAMQLANMMASGKLVPAHLQKSPGDCLMVIEQAMRWGMSPFAVAQCTSVIQGKLMFEGKLVSAALHSSGIMSHRLDFTFTGTGDNRAVIASGILKGEEKPREITVTLKEAKTNNAMWTKQPDQQLVYFATRAWARRHAPEVMLGVYSPEEFDSAPSPKKEEFAGTTLEAEPVQPHVEPSLDEPNGTQWLKNLRTLVANASTQDEVADIAGHASVSVALANSPSIIKRQINDILADGYARFAEAEDDGSSAAEPASVA